MDAAWVQVFILTFSECVAPAGKSVCQEQQFELEFLRRSECEYALQHLISMKDELDYVIVNHAKSGCAPSATEVATHESLAAITEEQGESANWRAPGDAQSRPRADDESHNDRLSSLKSCEETDAAAPCKIGEIIVEEQAGEGVEVWRQDN